MATGRADVDAALSSARYVALLDALVAAAQPHLTEAATVPAEEVLPPLVTAWKRLARDVGRLELDGSDHDWHETRIAAKKMRYATEALVPVFGNRRSGWPNRSNRSPSCWVSTRTRPLRLTRCTLWPPVVGSRPRRPSRSACCTPRSGGG